MAETYKVLGQVAPGATSETTLYTVPTGASAVISTIFVTNRSSSDATFRISISVGGGATATKDYIVYDSTIYANDGSAITVGATVGSGDIVRVYASSASISFNAFGTEIV